MASNEDIEALRKSLETLSRKAKADLASEIARLPLDDIAGLRTGLGPAWSDLIEAYGEMSASVGADMAEIWADELGVKPVVQMALPVEEAHAARALRWGVGTPDAAATLAVMLDKYVKRPARETITSTAIASRIGWARIPSGAETCSFCLMLSSRGGVYSRSTVGKRDKFHGDCDCVTIMIRSSRDYPKGFSPDAMYAQYLEAQQSAPKGTSSGPKQKHTRTSDVPAANPYSDAAKPTERLIELLGRLESSEAFFSSVGTRARLAELRAEIASRS